MTKQTMYYLPDASALRRARNESRAYAERMGAGVATCDAVALVIDELFNNAIEHGAIYRRNNAELLVTVSLEHQRIVLEFIDPEMPDNQVLDLAHALRDVADGMPALDSERGRGLFLISIYMDELRVATAQGGGLHLKGRMAES